MNVWRFCDSLASVIGLFRMEKCLLCGFGARDNKIDTLNVGRCGVADEHDSRDGVGCLSLHQEIHGYVCAIDNIGTQALLSDWLDCLENSRPSIPVFGCHAHDRHTASARSIGDKAHTILLAKIVYEEAQDIAKQRDFEALHRRRERYDNDNVQRNMHSHGKSEAMCTSEGRAGVFRGCGVGRFTSTVRRRDRGTSTSSRGQIFVFGARSFKVFVAFAHLDVIDTDKGATPDVQLRSIVELKVEMRKLGD